jgi:hypothetical protein
MACWLLLLFQTVINFAGDTARTRSSARVAAAGFTALPAASVLVSELSAWSWFGSIQSDVQPRFLSSWSLQLRQRAPFDRVGGQPDRAWLRGS